ncbi:uncharacterized protein B0P05DRAFT_587109 [Gilbertella persicaria]|uniref:uncharacterized protein n=1 Tax=Gilbertella persicaria TaxID=101096 RepID=UPI00221E7DE2|nr:uncharacterized protein B0P05DRAFT_587109 [Gilbertella persicaria]KAI8079660.1 hypothetical protein B0P05DRAFT_587109 [Gilbertella persicaria]
MEDHVYDLQLVSLLLCGAVLCLCVELIIRVVFILVNQKSWTLRILKIIMAVSMLIKTGIFSAFNSRSLQMHCLIVGRIGDLFLHTSATAGLAILLLRIIAIAPIQYQTYIMSFHVFLLFCRAVIGLADVMTIHVVEDKVAGICRFQYVHAVGLLYNAYDSAVDIYVSVLVSLLLYQHIKKLNISGYNESMNMCTSVILSNVIRAAILSVTNLASALSYIYISDNPFTSFVIWPFANILFVTLIGYDTQITNALKQLKKYKAEKEKETHIALSGSYPTGYMSSISQLPFSLHHGTPQSSRPVSGATEHTDNSLMIVQSIDSMPYNDSHASNKELV